MHTVAQAGAQPLQRLGIGSRCRHPAITANKPHITSKPDPLRWSSPLVLTLSAGSGLTALRYDNVIHSYILKFLIKLKVKETLKNHDVIFV